MTTTASHPPRQRHTKYAAMTVSFELVYSHALHARRRDGRCAARARQLASPVGSWGSTFTILIQSHREPRGRGESQTRNRRVLLLAGWCSFCELATPTAAHRQLAHPAAELSAGRSMGACSIVCYLSFFW